MIDIGVLPPSRFELRCRRRATPVITPICGGAELREPVVTSMVYTDDLLGCSILLVEDEAISAIDTKSVLEMAGAKIIGPAYSLRQGFHWLAGHQMDCAVLDINLNDGLVFDLADALAKQNIPIVFLSAHSLNVAPPQHRERRLVHKPFITFSLIKAIREAVAERRAQDKQPAA
ncbi:MAG TPA: response regulator [Dongiaceae bacterium]|jgi:CheY-like chemotaxis protein